MQEISNKNLSLASGGMTSLLPDGSIIVTDNSVFRLNGLTLYPDSICYNNRCINDIYKNVVEIDDLPFKYNGKNEIKITTEKVPGGTKYYVL